MCIDHRFERRPGYYHMDGGKKMYKIDEIAMNAVHYTVRTDR